MSVYNSAYNPASYLTDIYGWPAPENPYALFYPGPLADQPPHFDLCTPHVNAPPPHQNIPVPPRQPMGPRALQPSFSINPPHSLPILMPNPPTNTNYFGPPIPRGLLPPQWALGPPSGNVGQPPSSRPPNGRPPGGWGLAMDNFLPQCRNGNNYYYYYNARPPLSTQNIQDNTCNALAQKEKLDIQKPKPFTGLEDALDHGPNPNIFSALATLLCTMVLILDNLLAHLLPTPPPPSSSAPPSPSLTTSFPHWLTVAP
ncbi:hypothetical protein E4T56_gene5508 [Termitomyces sp. T112]|nr:hypothetical protein E4T56_gene5508 [Termitomyces sp. T112]